jgi:Astacin (Peptidase family M12A)
MNTTRFTQITFALPIAAAIGALMIAKAQDSADAEPALPEIITHPVPDIKTGFFPNHQTGQLEPINIENRDGLAVVQGDIVLGTTAEMTNKGSVKSLIYTKAPLWKKGVVPYVLAADFPNRKKVEEGLKDFERTKIKFRPRTQDDDNYIEFVLTSNPNIGGQSYYGMQGGRQELWLNANTAVWNTGTVIHELCHALSFAHEQCRKDRDTFVEIVEANVLDGYMSQFDKLGTSGADLGPYDFDSVTHYGKTAFSKNGQDTIRPRQGKPKFGQRSRLSDGDVNGINAGYAKELVNNGAGDARNYAGIR